MLFKDVIGLSEIKERLIESVINDRISHAQLFLENEGNGAFQLALAYARFILCANKQANDSCGQCPSCLKVNQLAHPDLHFSFPIQLGAKGKTSDIYLGEWKEMVKSKPYFSEGEWNRFLGNENKKGVIGKDESQNILKKLQLKAYEGAYKIVIIYAADALNASASNKLLKLIEEPPNKTIFLLTATSLESILPTIQSRTQLVKVSAPRIDDVLTFLESNGLNKTQSQEVAYQANGNMAKAFQLVENDDPQQAYFEYFVEWMRICFSRDVAKAIEFSANLAAIGREKQKGFISFSLEIFQKSLQGNYLTLDRVHVSPSQKGFLQKFMPFVTPSNVLKLHEHLTDAHYHVDRNANPKILFLDLSFKLFSLIKR